MTKKITSLFLVVIMLTMIITNGVAAKDYEDIDGHWAYSVLNKAISDGIMQGYGGMLLPDKNITRAELFTMLNNAFKPINKAGVLKFNDVEQNAWYYDHFQKAVSMGLLINEDKTIEPNMQVTREEAFSTLSKIFNVDSDTTDIINKFSDKDLISKENYAGVKALIENNYILGYNGKIDPKGLITRGEFAQVMFNIVKNYITADINNEIFTGTVVINKPDFKLSGVKIEGNLVIADGVGEGDIILDSVTVTGKVLVRGGGINSIKILGNSIIGTVTIAKVDGNVHIVTEGTSRVGTVFVNDGKSDIILEGNLGKVVVGISGVPVMIQNAKIEEILVEIPKANIIVDKTTKINTLNISKAAKESALNIAGEVMKIVTEADNTNVEVTGVVKAININAENINISGTGKVESAEIKGNNTTVSTIGTLVTIDKEVTGTIVGGRVVTGGTTTTSFPVNNGESSNTTPSTGDNSTPTDPNAPTDPTNPPGPVDDPVINNIRFLGPTDPPFVRITDNGQAYFYIDILNASQVSFSVDNLNWSPWVNYTSTKFYNITGLTDDLSQPKNVYVKAKNSVGKEINKSFDNYFFFKQSTSRMFFGVVKDTNTKIPLEGVKITVSGPTNHVVYTNSYGIFLVSGLEEGTYIRYMELEGYQSLIQNIIVNYSLSYSTYALKPDVEVPPSDNIISEFYLDNKGVRNLASEIFEVALGISETDSLKTVVKNAYAKLNDGTYLPVTINWSYDGAGYNSYVSGEYNIKGWVIGNFTNNEKVTYAYSKVFVTPDQNNIIGYYLNETGDSVYKNVYKVHYGISESSALSLVPDRLYSKLSNGTYVPLTVNWAFENPFNSNLPGTLTVIGSVYGKYDGGIIDSKIKFNISLFVNSEDILGYYLTNDGSDIPLVTSTELASGANSSGGLSTKGYMKLIDNSYVPVKIIWAVGSSSNNIPGSYSIFGSVYGNYIGGEFISRIIGVITILP